MSFQSSVSRNRVFVPLVLLVALAVMASSVLAAAPGRQDGPLGRLQAQSEGAVRVDTYPSTGAARWVEAEQGVLTREFVGQAPEAAARGFLATYGSLFGLTDQSAQLQLQSIKADSLGMQHVRFGQLQNNVPVFAADLIVHLNADSAVASANGYLVPDAVNLDMAAKLSEKQAVEIAHKQAGLADGVATSSGLTVINPGLITDQQTGTYLTYRILVDSPSQGQLAQWVFVDAQSGDVRFSYAAHPESRNRSTYNLKHKTSYASATLVRSESSPPVTSATNCTVADINNAHDYAGNTYDFYFTRFNRDSYNNAGAALKSYVCYSTNYQNAFWDGSKMTYGDGFAAADDVVAHELSHGVTEYASGLVYSNQSGALNESYSDIFGEAVDLTNTGGNDSSAVRWDMGEDIPGIGAIRDMMDPTRFSDPDWTGSSYYYCSTGDNGGVHTNSGVPNKAFALMVDGGSFRGYTIAAIGMDKAVQVQYRANEYKLTSAAKMLDNYNALNQSCNELYGAGSADCTNVKAALDAVKMWGPICGAGGATATPASATATPTRTPTATPASATATPTRTPTPVPGATATPTRTPSPTAPPPSGLVNPGFELGRNVGWSESSSRGYALVTTGAAHGGSWRAWLGGANSETSEISQSYSVPATGGTLYYWYSISSTDVCGYDYGYIRVNTTNLRTYNLCASGATGGYVQGSVSLAAYAGQTVTLKFRSTTDSSYSSSFYIDDVSVGTALGIQPIADPNGFVGDALTQPEPKPAAPLGVSEER